MCPTLIELHIHVEFYQCFANLLMIFSGSRVRHVCMAPAFKVHMHFIYIDLNMCTKKWEEYAELLPLFVHISAPVRRRAGAGPVYSYMFNYNNYSYMQSIHDCPAIMYPWTRSSGQGLKVVVGEM